MMTVIIDNFTYLTLLYDTGLSIFFKS